MYLGAVCLFIGAPLLLNSVWGIVLGLLMVLLVVARIGGEEQLLCKELAGYENYQKRVKYRLLPFVW
jgi:protein-S-isoprenylcysteine O-methyltransferase Ste14